MKPIVGEIFRALRVRAMDRPSEGKGLADLRRISKTRTTQVSKGTLEEKKEVLGYVLQSEVLGLSGSLISAVNWAGIEKNARG